MTTEPTAPLCADDAECALLWYVLQTVRAMPHGTPGVCDVVSAALRGEGVKPQSPEDTPSGIAPRWRGDGMSAPEWHEAFTLTGSAKDWAIGALLAELDFHTWEGIDDGDDATYN